MRDYQSFRYHDIALGAHKLHVGTDTVGGFRCEIAYLHGMLECAGAFLGEFAQEGIVDVGQLDKRNRRCEAEGFLSTNTSTYVNDISTALMPNAPNMRVLILSIVPACITLGAYIGQAVGKEYHKCRTHKLRTPGKLLERTYRGNACYQLHIDEFQGEGADQRTQHHPP